MKLKSFGCSFIFGSDLADIGVNGPYAVGSKLTWPALLANEYGYQYQCYAKPGSGNLQIAERVLNQLVDEQSTLYVINWSWIDRADYIVTESPWPGTRWNTIMPGDDSRPAKLYYKYLHNQYHDKLTTLINIKLVIDTLKQKGCPFIMTYMDELIFETEWHVTPAIVDLQNYIRPYMTQFENKTFLEFSKEKGFPISETLHPLELAHQSAFELIKSYNLV
jgi:hypothetical protein